MLLLISDANILIDIEVLMQREARNSLASMKAKGSRLPWGDVEKLLKHWELIER
jgi:hypothetical protein